MAFDFEGMQREEVNSQLDYRSTWPKGLVVFSLVLLLMAGGSKFGLDYLNAVSQKQLDKLDQEIETQKQQFPIENQKAVIAFEGEIDNLKVLLKSKIRTSKFLTSIANNTNPNIYFTVLKSNVKDKLIDINGVAKSYNDVAITSKAFESVPEVNKVVIKNTRNVDGKVDFSLSLEVSDLFFK